MSYVEINPLVEPRAFRLCSDGHFIYFFLCALIPAWVLRACRECFPCTVRCQILGLYQQPASGPTSYGEVFIQLLPLTPLLSQQVRTAA